MSVKRNASTVLVRRCQGNQIKDFSEGSAGSDGASFTRFQRSDRSRVLGVDHSHFTMLDDEYLEKGVSARLFRLALKRTMGHKSHDPCFHKKCMKAGVMTFVAHCATGRLFYLDIPDCFSGVVVDGETSRNFLAVIVDFLVQCDFQAKFSV